MKKFYNTMLGLMFLTQAFAQPQFTSSNCFQVGDNSTLGFSVYLQPFENIVSQRSITYTWDFSGENWVNPSTPYLFQPASQSIHGTFTSSEINEYSNISFARDLFFSYSANKDTLFYDGFYSGSTYLSRPHFPYLTFPLNINDSVFSYVKQYANPNQPTNATGSVSRYWVYDGFGDVTLPYGSTTNLFRIRTKQVDSVYVTSTANVSEELIWFRQADGIPVLRFVKNGSGVSAYHTSTAISTGISDSKENSSSIGVFPNPFSDFLQIDNQSGMEIKSVRIYNAIGSVVYSSDNSFNTINTTELNSGIYFIEFMTDNATSFRQRIIK